MKLYINNMQSMKLIKFGLIMKKIKKLMYLLIKKKNYGCLLIFKSKKNKILRKILAKDKFEVHLLPLLILIYGLLFKIRKLELFKHCLTQKKPLLFFPSSLFMIKRLSIILYIHNFKSNL